jgi:hypothetical protein
MGGFSSGWMKGWNSESWLRKHSKIYQASLLSSFSVEVHGERPSVSHRMCSGIYSWHRVACESCLQRMLHFKLETTTISNSNSSAFKSPNYCISSHFTHRNGEEPQEHDFLNLKSKGMEWGSKFSPADLHPTCFLCTCFLCTCFLCTSWWWWWWWRTWRWAQRWTCRWTFSPRNNILWSSEAHQNFSVSDFGDRSVGDSAVFQERMMCRIKKCPVTEDFRGWAGWSCHAQWIGGPDGQKFIWNTSFFYLVYEVFAIIFYQFCYQHLFHILNFGSFILSFFVSLEITLPISHNQGVSKAKGRSPSIVCFLWSDNLAYIDPT